MIRFYHYLLIFFNIIIFFSFQQVKANQPIPASAFLNLLGNSPKQSAIYEFLDIYNDDLTACRANDAYIKALELLRNYGSTGEVSERLRKLDQCSNLSIENKEKIAYLNSQITKDNSRNSKFQVAETSQEIKSEFVRAGRTSTATAPVKKVVKQVSVKAVAKNTVAKNIESVNKNIVTERDQKLPKSAISKAVSAKSNDLKAAGNISEPSGWVAELISTNLWKSGERGTSKLWRSENTLRIAYNEWSIDSGFLHMNSNLYNRVQPVGTAGTLPTGKQDTVVNAFIPKVRYNNDFLDIMAGTTPLGGEISPLPVGKVAINGEHANMVIFHDSVTDSILSNTGIKDIYGSKKMGRVIKTGLTLNWSDTVLKDYFYGAGLTGAYLYGENVKENNAAKAEGYIGRNISIFSVGLYTSFEHFTRNLNNYTYGHGGYYSPQSAATAALFASCRYNTDMFELLLKTSVGVSYAKTNDAQMFYGINKQGIYKGSEDVQYPAGAGIKLQKSFDTGVNTFLEGNILTSGSYLEKRLSAGAGYSF